MISYHQQLFAFNRSQHYNRILTLWIHISKVAVHLYCVCDVWYFCSPYGRHQETCLYLLVYQAVSTCCAILCQKHPEIWPLYVVLFLVVVGVCVTFVFFWTVCFYYINFYSCTQGTEKEGAFHEGCLTFLYPINVKRRSYWVG